jgi:hypothetical protein
LYKNIPEAIELVKRFIWVTVLVAEGSKDHDTSILAKALCQCSNITEKHTGKWPSAEGAKYMEWPYFVTSSHKNLPIFERPNPLRRPILIHL